MDDIGCRWTVWAGDGNRPGLAGKGVARPEGRYPRRNDRASALSGLAWSLIETCLPGSQPVARRPVNHSRLRDRFDKVTGTHPAGSSFPVNPPLGLWEVVGASGFQAAAGTRAQLERVSGRGGTFHSRPRSIAAIGFACLLPARGEPGEGAVVRTAVSRHLAPPGIDAELEAGFANLHPPTTARGFAL